MGVRLMVVDDHRLLAEALASALKLRGHRVLAATAPTSGAAAELVVSMAPEVCLFGTATPAGPGVFDPIVHIKRERPQVAVLVLGPVPSPRGIAAAFAAGASGYVRHDERIEGVERAMVKARAGEAAVAPQLLQGAFAELLTTRRGADLQGWMSTVEASELPSLHTFVRGLRKDLPTVVAGLTMPYSNGPIEGANTKVKLLKRQMYGRAGFHLLRQRILLS